MTTEKRSLFDWLTTAAAWVAVAVASWTAYDQHRQGQIRPQLAYGQFGAKYAVDGDSDELIHWRCWVTNQGMAGARDVRVNIWNIPETADIWCSMAHVVEHRTADTALIKIESIPPKTNAFVTIRPFAVSASKKSVPFAEKVYNADTYAGSEQWLETSAKYEIFEVLAKTKGFKSGMCGTHSFWDTPVTEKDLDIGRTMFTVNDR